MLNVNIKYIKEGNCWICTSHARSKDGYCRIMVNKKQTFVHRVIYEQYYGPIPEGLIIRHKCDNRACVNPEHLELGTHADNVRDRVERNRSAKGEQHGRAKLTSEKVKEIRNSIQSITTLACKYQVDRKAIYKIKNNVTWKEIV